MPFLYASGKFIVKYEQDGYGLKEWTSKENRKTCEDYDHPIINIFFRIENLEDEISPWAFGIYEKSAYEGQITCEISNNTFTFIADGKFKFKVHKDIPGLIMSGKVPSFDGVSYLRVRAGEGIIIENTLQFSKGKL
jgi:hypothetical protein